MTHDDREQYIPLPEQYSRRTLNAMYREIPLKDTTFRLLRKYFLAAANLYGIVPVRKVFEIVELHDPGLVSLDTFTRFAEIACHECEECHILGEAELYAGGRNQSILDKEVLNTALLNDGGEKYAFLKEMQYGKPYYIPPKKAFQNYVDPFYCEPSKENDALRNFLKTDLFLPDAWANQIYEELIYGTRCRSVSIQQAAYHLRELGIQLSGEAEQKFAFVFLAFRNNMRMQGNRGYTPLEIRDMRLGNAPAKKKVGRNDPCPCGSGKKYKNCCGK